MSHAASACSGEVDTGSPQEHAQLQMNRRLFRFLRNGKGPDPRRIAIGLVGLCLTLAVAGCTDYLDRRESISFAAGDAVATNKAIHTIDPWPREAGNTAIQTNGQRTAAAIERYNTGRVYAPIGVSTSTVAPQPAASAQPAGPALTN